MIDRTRARPVGNARASSSLPTPRDCRLGRTKNSVSSISPSRSIERAKPTSGPGPGSSATHHSAAVSASSRWSGSPRAPHPPPPAPRGAAEAAPRPGARLFAPPPLGGGLGQQPLERLARRPPLLRRAREGRALPAAEVGDRPPHELVAADHVVRRAAPVRHRPLIAHAWTIPLLVDDLFGLLAGGVILDAGPCVRLTRQSESGYDRRRLPQ